MADDVRSWPGYTDFARIAALQASRGRLYVVVDMETHKQVGEMLAAGGEQWGSQCLEQLNAVFAAQQPRGGLDRTRHAIMSWRAHGVREGGSVMMWYRSTIREHRLARRAEFAGAPLRQDSSFVHSDQRVMLIHAHWRASSPHARPTEPSDPGDDVHKLHGRIFVVGGIERIRANGRVPEGHRGLGVRTALVCMTPVRA